MSSSTIYRALTTPQEYFTACAAAAALGGVIHRVQIVTSAVDSYDLEDDDCNALFVPGGIDAELELTRIVVEDADCYVRWNDLADSGGHVRIAILFEGA
ncbi:MAG: hypothetical protein DRQ48_00310 [Gammaproteobacteria bacterium]|nr:MAG: hypothetical protein DRQ48_00310 [Gammaproteobacteria bacterium]